MNVAFILLSQLNRKSEERADPEPIMSDLRDSGDIEQAADVIIFPFRPVVYDPDYRPRDKAFLKIAKARDLPTGKIPVRFNAEITSFSDWTERNVRIFAREAPANEARRRPKLRGDSRRFTRDDYANDRRRNAPCNSDSIGPAKNHLSCIGRCVAKILELEAERTP